MSDTNEVTQIGSVFNPEPKTIEDFQNNAAFQLSNVSGWMSVKDYESALIKARFLVEALEEVVKMSNKIAK